MVKESRYFVDDRSGCVAVRDRKSTNPEDQGLWPETKGVVQFWSKKRVFEACPTCGRKTGIWEDGKAEIALAKELAAQLNEDHLRATEG